MNRCESYSTGKIKPDRYNIIKSCIYSPEQKRPLAERLGAESSAILYSLIESAKAGGLDPHSYLNLIFKELPKAAATLDFEKLLPHTVAGHYEVKPIFQKP